MSGLQILRGKTRDEFISYVIENGLEEGEPVLVTEELALYIGNGDGTVFRFQGERITLPKSTTARL